LARRFWILRVSSLRLPIFTTSQLPSRKVGAEGVANKVLRREKVDRCLFNDCSTNIDIRIFDTSLALEFYEGSIIDCAFGHTFRNLGRRKYGKHHMELVAAFAKTQHADIHAKTDPTGTTFHHEPSRYEELTHFFESLSLKGVITLL
jgi:hypothetical protein